MSIAEKLTQIAENEQRVYDAGKKAQYDAFWDSVQNYGNRKEYAFAFSMDSWDADTFNPKYPIKPTTAINMFGYWGYSSNMKKLIDLRNVEMDFSICTLLTNTFIYNTCVSGVGVIDTRSNSLTAIQGIFNGAKNLAFIKKLIIKNDGSTKFNGVFTDCNSLEEMEIEGVIGQNGFNVQWSPLSHDSLISIINALADKTSDTSGTIYTITLGESNLAKLSADELDTIDKKGWDYK